MPHCSLLAGVSVCRVIREVTGLAAELKWPNDVPIDRKVCGFCWKLNGRESVVVGLLIVNQQRMISGSVRERQVLLEAHLERPWRRF